MGLIKLGRSGKKSAVASDARGEELKEPLVGPTSGSVECESATLTDVSTMAGQSGGARHSECCGDADNQALEAAQEVPAATPQENGNIPGSPPEETAVKMGAENIIMHMMAIEDQLAIFNGQIENLQGLPQIIERQISANEKTESTLRNSVLIPIVKRSIAWYEKLSWIVSSFRRRRLDTARDTQALDLVLNELLNLGEGILESLCSYGIERILPVDGESRNCNLHYIAETRKTDKSELDGKIAECLEYGFFDPVGNKILKEAVVAVYKAEKKENYNGGNF